MAIDEDPFDAVLNLETTYEQEGYDEGLRDGKAQAHTSAFLFGIEKGFEKFIPMTHLRVRAENWAARYGVVDDAEKSSDPVSEASNGTARVEKHIKTLLALTDTKTLSLSNSDEAVGDFEERMKRAQAKVKVLERILREASKDEDSAGLGEQVNSSGGDIENPRLNPIALQPVTS